ncbi:MAG: XdhC family protein, partial [Ignavibacteriaceae bacterium]|nr:XdhC family protein [Ignavibacteriaceae bacterium]
MMEVFQTLVERIKENKPTVLVTVTKTKGSTPGRVGFKLLVDNEGRTTGTIGGGPV